MGIEAIRDRLEMEGNLIEKAAALQGVPVLYVRNHIPVKDAPHFVEDYEITPAYHYEYDKKHDKVNVIKKPWIVRDDEGVESYSLLPAAVVVSLVSQVYDLLLG